MTIMTRRNTVVSFCVHDLFKLYFSEFSTAIVKTGLHKPAAASAAVIVGFIGNHVDKMLLADNGFNDKAQIVSHRVAKGFTDKLARVLHSKFNF